MRSMLQEMESLHLISKSVDKKPMPLPGWHCLPTHHIPWVEQQLGNAHRIFFRVLYIESGGHPCIGSYSHPAVKGHFSLLLKKKSSGGKKRVQAKVITITPKIILSKSKVHSRSMPFHNSTRCQRKQMFQMLLNPSLSFLFIFFIIPQS